MTILRAIISDKTIDKDLKDILHAKRHVSTVITAYPRSPAISLKQLTGTIEQDLRASYPAAHKVFCCAEHIEWLLDTFIKHTDFSPTRLLHTAFYDINNTPSINAKEHYPLFIALLEQIFERYLSEPENLPFYFTGPHAGKRMDINDTKVKNSLTKYFKMLNLTPLDYLSKYPNTTLKTALLNTMA